MSFLGVDPSQDNAPDQIRCFRAAHTPSRLRIANLVLPCVSRQIAAQTRVVGVLPEVEKILLIGPGDSRSQLASRS